MNATNHNDYIKYLDVYLPMLRCNLNCEYCYVEGKNNKEVKTEPIKYSADYIAKCLSKERLGGCVLINICSDGETLLHHDLLRLTKLLLEEGHVVSIVSNGTLSNRFDAFLELPENLLERLFFKLSFHYLELKRLNLLECFSNNVNKIKNSPASFSVELGASDSYIPYLDEIKEFSMNNFGALPHITVLRDIEKQLDVMTKYPFEEYKKIWGAFNSPLFDIRMKYWSGGTEREFCYAGYFSGCISLLDGCFTQCHLDTPPFRKDVFANCYEPFPIKPIGTKCPAKHCVLCHAFLSFGDKPALETPTYSATRDRITPDGSTWLKPEIKRAYDTKFYNTNADYERIALDSLYSEKTKNTFFENIFSVKNEYKKGIKRKVVTIFGIKMKLKGAK